MKAKFQIIGTRIVKLDIENDFVMVNLQDENILKEIDVSYEVSAISPVEDEPECLTGNIMMYIHLRISDKESQMCLKVTLVMEGCFVLADLDEVRMKEMLAVNGTASMYSIARGIVSSVTSQVCMNGTVLLPMINVFQLKKSNED